MVIIFNLAILVIVVILVIMVIMGISVIMSFMAFNNILVIKTDIQGLQKRKGGLR
jgi:hypothetical protein